MAKAPKQPENIDETLAFEMIELTCDELETLSRAFKMIDSVCRELQSQENESECEEVAVTHIH